MKKKENNNMGLNVGIIVGIILVIFFIALISIGYMKAPPDKAFIVSGLKKRTVIGKAGVKIPFLERRDILDLKLMSIDVKTASPVPTSDFIGLRIDAVTNIKISSDPDKLALAEQNFLNQDTAYIGQIAQQVLEGNMREIISSMPLQKAITDRQAFADLVKKNASPDLASMGLDIVNFNVQNYIAENDVIENLGIDNITQIRKSAAISKAQGERDIAIAQSDADKQANDARINAQRDIANKNNELAVDRKSVV